MCGDLAAIPRMFFSHKCTVPKSVPDTWTTIITTLYKHHYTQQQEHTPFIWTRLLYSLKQIVPMLWRKRGELSALVQVGPCSHQGFVATKVFRPSATKSGCVMESHRHCCAGLPPQPWTLRPRPQPQTPPTPDPPPRPYVVTWWGLGAAYTCWVCVEMKRRAKKAVLCVCVVWWNSFEMTEC